MTDFTEQEVKSSRAWVIYPDMRSKNVNPRSAEAKLEEVTNLSCVINLNIIEKTIVVVRKVSPATFLGLGKIKEMAMQIKAQDIELMVFDGVLTPVQQRNLEKELKCKVIDRTALILEIFGERAQTREGVLQVELAALEYQKSRLVRSWTHLERQRGGFGFMGGPGERQIESDRRIINDRISKIKKELGTVKKTRTLHRKSRQKVPYPVVALVGYTNAGKSTLFNRVTEASVMAEDMLFATLDPTMRKLTLPSKREVILSDTVGFISDLPTELIAAFRATLEEVLEADLILHVRDIACEDTQAQKKDVLEVLHNLGLEAQLEEQMIEVLNKFDLVGDEVRERLKDQETRYIHVSAISGEGIDELLKAIDSFFAKQMQSFSIYLSLDAGKELAWLYAHGKNVQVKEDGRQLHVIADLSQKDRAQFQKIYG